jgi:hypothetical protein
MGRNEEMLAVTEKYDSVRWAARDEYERVKQVAWDEYRRVRDVALAEYNHAVHAIREKYSKEEASE